MLPLPHKIAFLLFAFVTSAFGAHAFYRLYRRISAGRADTDQRFDRPLARVWYALVTTLTQSRTFRTRKVIGLFHSLIFYGFTFYLLVNLVDAAEGFFPFAIDSTSPLGSAYNLFADLLSAGVLLGVIALVIRRFALPSKVDFTFNPRTLLHKDVQARYVSRDSILVSTFILFHVGSRAIGAAAKLVATAPDKFQPFATFLSHAISPQHADSLRIFGYWGALGSVLAFLAYFPYSKHIHIFMAPTKYLVARPVSSGVLPAIDLNLEAEEPKLGAERLEDLAWPRLLDAYACIQCNRCQDVCPATATGKSLSPSALEINKRMELNEISKRLPAFENGTPSPNPLLTFALSPEAAWACTTCGACIDICPVGDEPMLDIIDIRRNQVMQQGEFPQQLQSAFRGMERSQNPWGINHEKRMDWAEGLHVPTTAQNPEPDVLFWVGCAAAYDPQSQKTARAFVQLLDHANVDFAVLGKRECCTGDTARRAGNEYLYRQLAETNVATLQDVKPKLIVATCPHCMNSVGKEYKQLGGDFKVIHHTEYLEQLVAEGKLTAASTDTPVAFHDPCYLGRHNGVYDAPRNVLNILSNEVRELPRNKANSFCCGAGGAQFWKEEEPGEQRISDNRYLEAKQTLGGSVVSTTVVSATEGTATSGVLAVGCPFCKSMLESTPAKAGDNIVVKDIAELLLEGVQRQHPEWKPTPAAAKLAPTPAVQAAAVTTTPIPAIQIQVAPQTPKPASPASAVATLTPEPALLAVDPATNRKKWAPKAPVAAPAQEASAALQPPTTEALSASTIETPSVAPRKSWKPKQTASPEAAPVPTPEALPEMMPEATLSPALAETVPTPRKAWKPKQSVIPEPAAPEPAAPDSALPPAEPVAAPRKAWKPKASIPKDPDPLS